MADKPLPDGAWVRLTRNIEHGDGNTLYKGERGLLWGTAHNMRLVIVRDGDECWNVPDDALELEAQGE